MTQTGVNDPPHWCFRSPPGRRSALGVGGIWPPTAAGAQPIPGRAMHARPHRLRHEALPRRFPAGTRPHRPALLGRPLQPPGVEPRRRVRRVVGWPEFNLRYGALDNAAFITLVYKNVLNRARDAGWTAGVRRLPGSRRTTWRGHARLLGVAGVQSQERRRLADRRARRRRARQSRGLSGCQHGGIQPIAVRFGLDRRRPRRLRHTRRGAHRRVDRAATTSSGCSIASGKWLDAYTGATVTVPGELDIGHLVPLANAGGRSGPRGRLTSASHSPTNSTGRRH